MGKVWGLVGASIGAAGVGTMMTIAVPVSPIIPAIASFIPLFGIMRTNPGTTKPAVRAGLLGTFAVLTGMTLSPLVQYPLMVDPIILPMAFGATTTIFVGASLVSLVAPRGRMLSMGGPLTGGLFGLMGLGIMGIFYPHPMLLNVYMYGGILLFAAFTAYETQQILNDYRMGVRDAVSHSVGLFIDFVSIFRKILFLLTMRGDD